MWGATRNDDGDYQADAVSIHAPVWGATQNSFPEVRDHRVSIHAPVWGATFQFTAKLLGCRFQSTHPCGVRPGLRLDIDSYRCFNPRTRVGCDDQVAFMQLYEKVSIHAPVWGATAQI